MLTLLDHEILGIQGFAGVDGGAVDRAAAAFEARAHVEQLLPGVLLDLRDAEGFCGFEILDRSEASARTQVAEEKIERPENQMTQLGERKTKQQHEHAQHMHQPQPSMVSGAGAEAALDSSHDASHVCPFVERGMRGVDPRALEHQAGDGGQHHHRHRKPVAEPVLEIVAHLFGGRIAQQGGFAKRAPRTFHQHADDQQQEEGVHRGFEVEVEVAVVEVEIEAEQVEEVAQVAVDQHDGGADEQSDEGDVERVMHPAPRLANHAALPEGIAQ